MKTTIDIPKNELLDAIRYTKAKTKREAVNLAIADFNRRKRVEELVGSFGQWEIASNEELESADLQDIEKGK